MGRSTLQRIEIVCTTCGVMAELMRPKNSTPPKLCDCPQPEIVRPSSRPRLCENCSTRLNRYNQGSLCGACAHKRDKAIGLL